MTAVILMKNWIMSMTSTPHSPECAAKTTFRTPTTSERLPALEPEEDAGDLARGEVDRRHDHAVEEQPEVDRAEAAHDGSRPCRSSGSRRTRGRSSRPIAATAARRRTPSRRRSARTPTTPSCRRRRCADDVGDEVRRVAAEGRGDHREAGEPPRHRAARREELGRALCRRASPKNSAGTKQMTRQAAAMTQSSEREMHGGGDYTGPTSSGATRVAVYNRNALPTSAFRLPRRRVFPTTVPVSACVVSAARGGGRCVPARGSSLCWPSSFRRPRHLRNPRAPFRGSSPTPKAASCPASLSRCATPRPASIA